MSDLFKGIAKNTNHIVIFAWPLGLIMAIISVVLMWEDYQTSRAGYMALPTLKVNSGLVTFAVAALPQVAQIVLFYIFGRDTRRGWAGLLAIGFFLVDLGTDAWFKSGGQWSLAPLAIVESLFIFTLGSEVLFTIAVGFIAETFGEFVGVFGVFLREALDGIQTALEAIGGGNNEEARDQQSYPQNQKRRN